MAERNRLLSVLPFLLLGAAMVVATVFYLHIGRDTTYFAEEWVYFSSGVDSAKLIDPLNGHLLIVVMGLYNLVFQTIGDSYLAIRLLALGLELLAVGLFFHLLRVRIGPWAALPLAVLFLFFGPGWGVVWGPPGILNMTASSAGFGMLIMLERHTLKRDVAACALLTIAVGTFGLGVVFAVAAAADVWLRGQAERWKRAWVVAIPILLYLIWEVWARSAHPESADRTKLSNIGHAPEVVAESFGGVATALIGVMHLPGDPVLSEEAHLSWLVGIVFLIGIAFLVWRNRRSLRPSFWPYLLLPLSFWVLVSLTGEPPVIDRYLYPGSMFLVLFVAEVLVGKRIPLPAILVTAAVCAFAIFTSNSMLKDGSGYIRDISGVTLAEFSALELVRDQVADDFLVPPPAGGPLPFITASDYFAAQRAYGTPAYPPSELPQASEVARDGADQTLVAALEVAPRALAGAAPSPEACLHFDPAKAKAGAVVNLPPGGFALHAPAETSITLRRYGDTFAAPVESAPGSGWFEVLIPRDRSSKQWHGNFTSLGELEVCRLP